MKNSTFIILILIVNACIWGLVSRDKGNIYGTEESQAIPDTILAPAAPLDTTAISTPYKRITNYPQDDSILEQAIEELELNRN